jgi:two-component system sensor histidine kinase KdpD
MKVIAIWKNAVGRGESHRWREAAAGAALCLSSLAIAYVAHLHGRPVTAALIAIVGVVAVGGLLGLRAGAVAGLGASITYNLLFTDPFLRFSLSSADDLVPVIALNLSAIASGLIAGRLHDRAVAAEQSERRVSDLLWFSEGLQSAVTLSEVEKIASSFLAASQSDMQLFILNEQGLEACSEPAWGRAAAQEVFVSGLPQLVLGDHIAFQLKSADRRLGVLAAQLGRLRHSPQEIAVFLPLLTLAIQRCQLAEQLAEGDVLKKSEAFKTALLSSVSHDLRTPLAAIAASAGSLAEFNDKLDRNTQQELLSTIQDQCSRLDRLTANLLNLGRIESGLDVEQMPIVDAIEVLGSTLVRMRKTDSNLTIKRDFRTTFASVRADEALLEQVFFNVLENAVRHTPAKTPIHVDAARSGNAIIIAIEDDGPGLPPKEAERIFERFYQVRQGKIPASGSGLGLSIAKGFTELIGGDIRACRAHRPMRGARFEVILPLLSSAS